MQDNVTSAGYATAYVAFSSRNLLENTLVKIRGRSILVTPMLYFVNLSVRQAFGTVDIPEMTVRSTKDLLSF